MDILLILGNVTEKQADPLVRAMYQRGLSPRIRRMTTLSDRDFGIEALREWEQANGSASMQNMPHWEPWTETRVAQLTQGAIGAALQDASVNDVKAILFQEGAAIDKDWNWVTAEVSDDVPCYRLERSETDDSQFLVGRGFGEVLEISEVNNA